MTQQLFRVDRDIELVALVGDSEHVACYHLLHNTLTAATFEALLDIPSSAGHRLEILSFPYPTE